MNERPEHRSVVFASPWPGVHGTCIHSSRHYGRHWHATHGVGLLEHGAQRSASGRGPVEAQAGDLITTNPGEVHDGRPLGGPSRRWRMLYFEPGMLASMTGDAGGSSGGDVALTRPVFQDAGLRNVLERLFGRLQAWDDGAQADAAHVLACEEALVQAAALLLDRHATAARARTAARADLRQVRDRLADEAQGAPTLADLAAMTGLSRWQVLRQFEQTYGLPPHAWLRVRRAEQARRLIRGGTGLAQAAASCGFADQSHMTRLFLRQFGFTPGAWRRAVAPHGKG